METELVWRVPLPSFDSPNFPASKEHLQHLHYTSTLLMERAERERGGVGGYVRPIRIEFLSLTALQLSQEHLTTSIATPAHCHNSSEIPVILILGVICPQIWRKAFKLAETKSF